MANSDIPEGVLFGMGNPLLDISAPVDKSFLQTYNLEANNAILAGEEHLPLFDQMMQKYQCDFIAGGATQNSIRTAQWLLRQPQVTTYIGCIGKDKFADLLINAATNEGLRVNYMQTSEQPTGTCAVLLTDKHRSLVANLGAAEYYKEEHLLKEENWRWVEKAKIYYSSGYFLKVSPSSMMTVAKHSHDNGKIFATNISAPYLITLVKDDMMRIFPYIDILFGNETEFDVFAKEHSFGTSDLKEIGKKIAAMPKVNPKYPRIVIITQSQDPVIVVRDGECMEFPVPPLNQDDIVDSNGAGDAFAGGYLSQLVQGKPITECVRCGIYAARVILQRSGITFPAEHDYQ
ncbi:Adenosine kinase [Trichoplax sp. H2]|nr:Adenosine kinase [Trichoplax sp. H2]|eukprot:RDD44760.1 Adenosine kinase [Trichoplax sp. H2]